MRTRVIATTVALLCPVAARAQEQPAEPPPVPAEPAAGSRGDRWSGSVDLGLDGASGNTENFNSRVAFSLNRKTDVNDTKLTFTYLFETDEGDTSQSRGELNLLNDRDLGDSRFTLFGLGRAEYDEFKDWRWRLTLAGGLGYKFLELPRTTLIGRAGPAATREFGGTDEEWHFEPLVGLDLEHRPNPRSKLYFSATYYISGDEFPDYRFLVKAGYEVLIDPGSGLTFKIGVEDEYDQSPGPGVSRNDVRYFATVGWVF